MREPWKESVLDGDILIGGKTTVVCHGPDRSAIRRRIVAAVNACQGLPTEVLEANALDSTVGRLVIQRAELLAACKEVLAWADHSRAFCEREDLEVLAQVKDAIAKAEGG
jgi:hypothetical protein